MWRRVRESKREREIERGRENSRAGYNCVRYVSLSASRPATYLRLPPIMKVGSISIVSQGLSLMKCKAGDEWRRQREWRKKTNRTMKSLRCEQKLIALCTSTPSSTWHSMAILCVHFFVRVFLQFFFLARDFVTTRRKNFLIRFLPTSLCLCDRAIHYALNCFLLVSHLPSGIRLATLLVEWGLECVCVCAFVIGLLSSFHSTFCLVIAMRANKKAVLRVGCWMSANLATRHANGHSEENALRFLCTATQCFVDKKLLHGGNSVRRIWELFCDFLWEWFAFA